jgi:hydroxyacylglutathione hydrolase
MENFVYLVADEASNQALVVDSGWETEPVKDLASSLKVRVKYVCATHHHFDHVKTLKPLAEELGAQTVAFAGSVVGPDLEVRDGDVLKLGEGKVKVIHTPGHTEDGVCYYDGTDLFTGDTLFVEAWGRTDLPGGSADVLFSSLHDVIMSLPVNTVIYPGHDYGSVPFRTLGEESRRNPALLARTAGELRSLAQD